MSTYNNLADFSSEGFNIGKDAKVMAYLHGLSDFWVFMFEDASKINMLMEANAVLASDVYNKFLQMTSILSLEDIYTLTNHQMKLVMISEDDAVAGKVEVYSLPSDTPLKYSRCLVNRAFLPTTTLEVDTDFVIDQNTGQISFAQPLSGLGFPFRTLSTGKKQYALWAIDAKIDDQLIYDYYAKLINVDPTTSTDLFKGFIYGMYYLYVNGPHLDTVRRGLNLALGIPLARDSESVLEIRKYLNTDQWLVITDLNSYLIPYGLEPTVAIDDVLTPGQEIASWIEVKDWISDGDWWINFMLPAQLMPNVPTAVPGGSGVNADSTPDRYMTQGSYADWLMRNYLKTHTFLVNVKTLSFKNIQNFEQLSSIIKQVKPSYTCPIYVWTVPVGVEPIQWLDTLTYSLVFHQCEILSEGINRFNRGNTTDPHTRGDCPTFIRMSVPAGLDSQSGYDANINGVETPFNGGTLTGFIAPQKGYRSLTDVEDGWNRTLRSRHNDQYLVRRSRLDYLRDGTRNDSDSGLTAYPLLRQFPDMRFVALHTTTLEDVKEKFAACNQPFVDQYIMPLLQPTYNIDMINTHAIDDSFQDDFFDFIMANFSYLFQKGSKGQYVGSNIPRVGSEYSFVPAVNQIYAGDFLAFTKIDNQICGAYWVTSNFNLDTQPYVRHESRDTLTVQVTGPANRGGALMGSPYYMTRSANSYISYNSDNAINDLAVNDSELPSATVNVTYNDALNASFPKDRSGRTLITRRVFN